jgi:hypothetical protein
MGIKEEIKGLFHEGDYMVIYRLFGTLDKELKFNVYEWLVEKETGKTFEIISNEKIAPTKKRLNKEKIGVVKTNTINTLDSLISFNVYLTNPNEIDQYKIEITTLINKKVKYYENKLIEKKNALLNSGINI